MSGALPLTLLATIVIFTAFWAVSLIRKDASVVDFYWGPGFVVIGWLALALDGADLQPLRLAILLAVTLWGLRLGWHIFARHRGEEDARYADMRARHGEKWPLKSLAYVFLLQAAIQWIAASAVLTAALGPARGSGLVVLSGLAIFACGFALEALSDRAVVRFRSNPESRGKLLTTGLHGFVRYPSYLGEIVLQWGLAIAAFGLTFNPLAFVGAALMTVLIQKVSGVPLLDAQFSARPGFAEWAQRVPALWPLPRPTTTAADPAPRRPAQDG